MIRSLCFLLLSLRIWFLSIPSPRFWNLVLPHSLLSSTSLQIKEVVSVQTNTGWKTVLCAGKSRNTSPSALNVPLEQPFLRWETMWRATGKRSEEQPRHGKEACKKKKPN